MGIIELRIFGEMDVREGRRECGRGRDEGDDVGRG
jgi:hypothetical protein